MQILDRAEVINTDRDIHISKCEVSAHDVEPHISYFVIFRHQVKNLYQYVTLHALGKCENLHTAIFDTFWGLKCVHKFQIFIVFYV